MTSIIETAYGATVAARLCAAIDALDEATRSYQTTGDALLSAQHAHQNVCDILTRTETHARATLLTAADLGKSAEQRAAKLAERLAATPLIARMRENRNEQQWALADTERSHKNAYHQMESLRAAIAGYAAVLGAVKDCDHAPARSALAGRRTHRGETTHDPLLLGTTRSLDGCLRQTGARSTHAVLVPAPDARGADHPAAPQGGPAMTATKQPAPFSARRRYVCPTCGKSLPMGGWQRSHDYDDHLAAHQFWVAVRAEAVAVATWPLLLAWTLWVRMTAPRRHEDWTLPLALLIVAGALLATMLRHGGR